MAITGNTGSVVIEVHNLIENIPTSLSGTNMNNVIERQANRVKNITNQTVNTTAIDDKYMPVLISLTASEVLGGMEMTGVDAASVKLGDFAITKGGKSNTTNARDYFEKKGLDDLKYLRGAGWHYKTGG